jgi:hypothetical protein
LQKLRSSSWPPYVVGLCTRLNLVAAKRKRKKPKTIAAAEAMRRLKAMVDRIGRNVTTALWAEALLEAGNKKVKPSRMVYLGANAYNPSRKY